MMKGVPNLISYLQDFSQIFPHFIYIFLARKSIFGNFWKWKICWQVGPTNQLLYRRTPRPDWLAWAVPHARRYKTISANLSEAAAILPAFRPCLSERRAAVHCQCLCGKSPCRVLPSLSTAPCHRVLAPGCSSPLRSPPFSVPVGGHAPLLDIKLRQSVRTVPAPNPPLSCLENKPEVANRRFNDVSVDRSPVPVASRRP
jgi:hypothetical protein